MYKTTSRQFAVTRRPVSVHGPGLAHFSRKKKRDCDGRNLSKCQFVEKNVPVPLHSPAIRCRRPWVLVIGLLYLLAGCATPWEKSALLKDSTPNLDRYQGPTQRSLKNLFKKKQEEEDIVAGRSLKPIAGTEDYLAATEIFKEERYDDARKAFKKVAKKYKKSEIREDALFMQAESAWQQDQYAIAHDAYAILLKEYPSTRHMNVVSERLFKIGRLWLDFPEVAKLQEIHQVNFDQPTKELPSEEPPKVPKSTPIFVPNFRDKQKPLFDTAGNGVAALSAVWMNDPTGPLADDAMMLVASYHARRGNYVEADRFFQMLRETFPHSPHVENAFVLGSHVKLMSYQGPNYENRTLQEAQLLKESTLKLYPNNREADRIRDELAKIEDAKALDLWTKVGFYLRKDKKRSAAIYCHEVINQYPKSPYASQARAKLVELGPEYASGAAFLQSVDPPKTNFLEQVLETPPSFRLKKSPMIGQQRDVAKQDEPRREKMSSRRTAKADERSQDRNSKDSDDEGEPEQSGDAEPSPKRRRSWFPFGSVPEKLPDDADQDARQLNPRATGRTRI